MFSCGASARPKTLVCFRFRSARWKLAEIGLACFLAALKGKGAPRSLEPVAVHEPPPERTDLEPSANLLWPLSRCRARIAAGSQNPSHRLSGRLGARLPSARVRMTCAAAFQCRLTPNNVWAAPRRGGVGQFEGGDGQAGWRRIARPTTPNTSSANSSCGSEFALFGDQQ